MPHCNTLYTDKWQKFVAFNPKTAAGGRGGQFDPPSPCGFPKMYLLKRG